MSEVEPTVFIVDDDDAARNGIRALMESTRLKVKTFASAEGFLESYEPDAIGCLVLDVRMPRMSGLMLQDEMNRRGAGLPIIFITGHADVSSAVSAMKNGACDFIEKPVRGQLLLDKVQSAIENQRKVRQRKSLMEQIQARRASLTTRESEILDRVKVGRNVKSMALEFSVSRKTIDGHLTNIREKMGVGSTAELIMLLYESGLLQPSYSEA
jgi:two-component system response regulator DctR